MEAPKCPYCGKREWRHICSAAGRSAGVAQSAEQSEESEKTGGTGRRPSPALEVVTRGVVCAETKPVDKKLPERAKFDRRAYQREYMRKRRLSLKVSRGT